MAFALSFASAFFRDEFEVHPFPWGRPESVEQALIQISSETWEQIAHRIFHCDPIQLDTETVIRKIEETNTCLNIDSPVEVFIDPAGEFTVRVYDKQ